MTPGKCLLLSLGIAVQVALIRMLLRYVHEMAEERRQADEWHRQFARGLTAKPYHEWKMTRGAKRSE